MSSNSSARVSASTHLVGAAIISIEWLGRKYLLLRLRTGHPITTFDISNLPPLKSQPILDALSGVKGLKVLYRLMAVKAPGIVEYTCGCDSRKSAYHIVVLLSLTAV